MDYRDPSLSPELRAKALLQLMTPEEKVGQLCKGRAFDYFDRKNGRIELHSDFREWMKRRPFGSLYGVLRADWWTRRDFVNGVTPELARDARNSFQQCVMENSRLGIPVLFVEEAPHGLMALGASVFPTGLGMGATFDPELLEKIGRVMGEEGVSAGIASLYAPILDLAVDARWSRCEECFSENAYHCTELSRAMVRGMRKAGMEPTLKHYVGGGHSEGGHNAFSAHIGTYELFNRDLRPFRACIQEGAPIVMSTYHDVDGEPCTGSRWLLNDILREYLGFRGFVIADGGAVELLHRNRFAEDLKHAAARAVKAGCDGDSGHDCLTECGANIMDAFEAGILSENDLDLAVGRLLELKFRLGLFEHPYTDGKPECVFSSAEHQDAALEAARKSLVLLKNSENTLPIGFGCSSLAVIGPNADNKTNMLGDYTAPQKGDAVVSLLDGIRKLAGERGIQVHYAAGCGIRKKDRSGFDEAVKLAKESDYIIFVPGGCSSRYGNVKTDPVTGAALPPDILDDSSSEKECGEGTDRATLCLSGVQMDLFRELASTGKPVIVVPVLGRPLLLQELCEKSSALLCAWYPGMCGGTAVAEALFGVINPGGKLPISLPRCEGQLPVSSEFKRRNYIDCTGLPLFPFGYGLSYTDFHCSGLRFADGMVELEVRNTGRRSGDAVIQFYLQSLSSDLRRPDLELFGFRRITLQPGERRKVAIALTKETAGYYDRAGKFVDGAGEYMILAGNSPESLLKITVSIQ